MMKNSPSVIFAVLCLFSLLIGTTASAQNPNEDVPIARGEHWVSAPEKSKRAYLLGVANVLEIEQAMHGDDVPADDASLVPVMIRGLKNMTLTQVMEALDKWYADNPDRLKRPVLETIWFELAKPNS